MKEIENILQRWLELTALPDIYQPEIKDEMPQDAEACRTYSFLVTSVLFRRLEESTLNLAMLRAYLLSRFAQKQYHELHMCLIACYVCVGLEPPPYFLEFGQYDDLLELLLNEIVLDFDEFLSEICEQEGAPIYVQ